MQKFINRELSWLEFNERVLEEAEDNSNPLLERLKFLAITSSNLDEFFMVRVAALNDQVQVGYNKLDPSGLTPAMQLTQICTKVHSLVKKEYNTYTNIILPLFNQNNIQILKPLDLNSKQLKYLEDLFTSSIYPVLTPMVVDSSRPFPLILNKSLNIGVELDFDGQTSFATVQVPSVLERYIKLPSIDSIHYSFILLEDVIKLFMENLFLGYKIESMSCFRITRNADLSFDEEGAEDLLKEIQQSLQQRRWGNVIRLESEESISDFLLNTLIKEMDISTENIFKIKSSLDLTFLMKLTKEIPNKTLLFEDFTPVTSKEFKNSENIFDVIKKNDILLHHPYESFEPVIKLVEEASVDPTVLAIKQTLYRVSGDSPLTKALARAAENGKQVTVLLELKARFDEHNNIEWAKKLEKAGCHVIYGLVGLKTHCKILLIVRREKEGITRYVHMGTGNYNDITAKFYTDIGLLTCKPKYGADASAIFNMLSGYSKLHKLFKVYVAPLSLRNKFYKLIDKEIEHAKNGKKASIIAKMNSLTDKEIIEKLYEASAAGVKIKLIIRGICCLIPGKKDLSESIQVISVVGRFLEHSRVFYFYNDGKKDIYLSSADWMHRNLSRRVELLFPIEDPNLKNRINNYLEIYLKDNVKARKMTLDGSYHKVSNKQDDKINSQESFHKLSKKGK
ncbi:RNA degradosome polyphosphate kinase [Clostridium grantii]|uniref:Polyphosphate kinase n=1 Tax=Clostridium grantii DSM 8605 TaxID=1121316 RepID=A0A1M5UHK9_9CLOT|nr:RNA degradosome polyphosphate kinase [Clostridium grantii]SHH62525.1 polyphosphate kinase [Clostridium grantii DSM 8605]